MARGGHSQTAAQGIDLKQGRSSQAGPALPQDRLPDAPGYNYYDDLVARGYVNTQGTPGDSSDDTLVDANGNGVADLHEDLYNLAPVSGPQARPYIGTVRRCAPRSFTSQGAGLSMPDLAVNAACTPAFVRQSIPDARPGTHPPTAVDVVGGSPTEDSVPDANGYSDLGLFARIPNLLEPAHAMNNQLGLGHLLFLLADDDGDRTTFNQLGIVPDTDDFEDGIPDYDVSRYDAHGLLRPVNPDPGITPNDRTVDLGRLPAGKELVFFLVTQYQSVHSLDENQVYPCLRKALNGQCTLHLKAPIQVFFSKAKWNLDQDPVGQMPVAQRNIGCEYNEQCNVASPQSSATACYVANSSQRLCGWLDWEALMRLRQPDHGSLFLPMAAASVFPSGNGNMPHLMMNAPLTTNGQWLMGFEDLPGGADRDFNDVVFLLRTVTEGRVRSRVLSQDDASCRIAQVSFRKSDGLDARCSPQTSIEDPDMRHGRKSKRFNGYKQHLSTDLDTDLVVACAVTPANRPMRRQPVHCRKTWPTRTSSPTSSSSTGRASTAQ
ncbi:DUF4114 domain-containing protein [Corallococcus carmarthensis]|nr:DUF4114 domain-containing protein [Corallococcus carmarthensis]